MKLRKSRCEMTRIKLDICLCSVLFMCLACQPVITSMELDYRLLEDFDISLDGTDYLLFEIKSCGDLHLLLMQNKSNFHSQLYEVVIGGWNNTKSALYKERSSSVVAYVDHEPLDCNLSRTFWIDWKEGSVHVGSGSVVGKDAFIKYNDSDPLKVNHVSVSPGNWTFYSANCECCSQEQRFCQALLESGATKSGVYNVTAGDNIMKVYCDMETDNGGWLVFQRRQDGSEDFYRDWLDYENGFGNLNGEFWLGNRHLYSITSSEHYQLRVDLEDWEGIKAYAKYHTFIVAHKCENYKLTVLGYSGTAGDAFAYHNGRLFTTKDNDNDYSDTSNCAKTFDGGWWYGKCHYTNPNGLYLASTNTSMANGVTWNKWRGNHYSLKSIELKIREICKL